MEEQITALLSGIAGGRRYWVRAPQKLSDGSPLPKPYIVMFRIDGIRGYTYQGSDGLVSSRIQANCYGSTYSEAKTATRALVALLDGYSGGTIHAIFIESDGRDLTASDAGDVTTLVAIAVDFIVHHQA